MSKNSSLKQSVLTEEEIAKISALNEIALSRGQTLAQMALSWVLRRKEVASVIIGASSREQIEDNLSLNAEFTEQELAAIDEISKK